MSRRKKNAGKGFGMMFHGAFASKADAKKKERQTHGFIQPRNIRGERRYVVMSERKNPIRRKKNQVRYLGGSEGWEARHGDIRATAGTAKEALHQLRVLLKLEKPHKGEFGRKHKRHNAMDLMVMGANPSSHYEAAIKAHDEAIRIYQHALHAHREGKMSDEEYIKARRAFDSATARFDEAYAKEAGWKDNPAGREMLVHPGETITLKVNPSAEAIREEFTGREYEYTFISNEPHMPAGDYPKLGDMMGISYKPVDGGQVQAIGWYEGSETVELVKAAETLRTMTDAPVLVSALDRRQLYFVGGNQDVSPLGMEELGEARVIVYRERKHFDDFSLMNYVHKFGEENGKRPTLFYDRDKNRLLLEGGDYEVRPEGIVN